MEQFVDLCILLGCDYCDSIKGIGPTRAVQLIKQHGTLEKILDSIDRNKYPIPEDWPYKEARRLFLEPDVHPTDSDELKFNWEAPDEAGLIQFLVKDKGFNEDRVKNGIKRLVKSRKQSTQGRLDGFVKVIPRDPATKRKFDNVVDKKNDVKGRKK